MNTPHPPPVLSFASVSARRRSGTVDVQVIHEVTLSVASGEFVAVMGPSGSGKTTLLQLAAGLHAPSAGRVILDGVEMHPTQRKQWALARRRTIGMVHQRLDLLGGLSVLDNAALPLLLDGTSTRRAHELARDALERLAIIDLAAAVPEELSVGRQQLVAVARAIVGERKVILADEPTAALDTVAAERVVETLASLADAGLAVVMATHDARLGSWAHRIVELRDGVAAEEVAAR